MAHLESLGTLDKLSELHSMTKTQKTVEEPEEYVDFDALENAAENLMQHLSVDHLDMLHYRFMTGKLDFCFCDYILNILGILVLDLRIDLRLERKLELTLELKLNVGLDI